MTEALREAIINRGITRLCHFTPSRNLVHIATDPRGILATKLLSDDERAIYNPTDLARYDGQPGHVCCSIQYPNAWYFRKARADERIFTDWVVLLLSPDCILRQNVKFCTRNAAAGGGQFLAKGLDAFNGMFAESVSGSQSRIYTRCPGHPSNVPTDQQAEVMIPDSIDLSDVIGLAVCDASQARREFARLTTLNAKVPAIYIIPEFFDPQSLNVAIRSGRLPVEHLFEGGVS